MIYLDYNATTPIDPRVSDAVQPYLKGGVEHRNFGNPSSAHQFGTDPQKAVEQARQQVAELIGASSNQFMFTSGGSESNNTVLKGVASASNDNRNHIIVSAIEHPAIIEPCEYLRQQGYKVTYLPVDENARVSLDQVEQSLRPDTLLVSVMHSNNEVGTLQPVADIVDLTAGTDTLVHTDASQSVGKVPLDVAELGVDFLTVAGHKLYAPKGIGALYTRRADHLDPLIHGAEQENGLRAGTENVPMIVGLGKACEIAEPESEAMQLRTMRDRLWNSLNNDLENEIILNGHPDKRLPNTLNVSFAGYEADAVLEQAETLAASTGSACHSNRIELSPVLEAMGVDPEVGKGAIRLSTGRFTRRDDVTEAVAELVEAIKNIN